jgi:hypothetical protein
MMSFLPFLLFVASLNTYGQDTAFVDPRQVRKELGLLGGYSKEIGAEDGGAIHMAELGLVRGTYGGGHLFATAAQASLQFGIHGDKPVLVPRVGAWVAMLIGFGVEVAYYTDFQTGALVLSPGIGYGVYPLNLSIEPNIYLFGKDFRPAGGGTLSLTYRLVTLKRKVKWAGQ